MDEMVRYRTNLGQMRDLKKKNCIKFDSVTLQSLNEMLVQI